LAKRGTLDHPKTLALASFLAIDQAHAFGLLEALWHFTYHYAPRGDIGRFADDVIVGGMRTRIDPKLVIDALTKSGWIDKHPDPGVRLCIHDWQDHADDATKKKLERAHTAIVATPSRHCSDTVATVEPQRSDDGPPRAREPSHPIPSHPIPSHAGARPGPPERARGSKRSGRKIPAGVFENPPEGNGKGDDKLLEAQRRIDQKKAELAKDLSPIGADIREVLR